jgi:hypothetical protein
MNNNQKNTIKDLADEHIDFVAKYGVSNSNHFQVFEDENGDVYVFSQRVTLSADFSGMDYDIRTVKVDKAGFDKEMDAKEYGEGGHIEYLKKLKRVKYDG